MTRTVSKSAEYHNHNQPQSHLGPKLDTETAFHIKAEDVWQNACSYSCPQLFHEKITDIAVRHQIPASLPRENKEKTWCSFSFWCSRSLLVRRTFPAALFSKKPIPCSSRRTRERYKTCRWGSRPRVPNTCFGLSTAEKSAWLASASGRAMTLVENINARTVIYRL